MQNFDTLFRNGTLVTHNGIGTGDIGVKDGRTVAIGDLAQASAGKVVDCTGLHVLPGVMDTQVHFREPGLEHKEDLETGSRAAVMGGVTAVCEMPNTNPLTITEDALNDKLARAKNRMH
jgi:dihydroorotase